MVLFWFSLSLNGIIIHCNLNYPRYYLLPLSHIQSFNYLTILPPKSKSTSIYSVIIHLLSIEQKKLVFLKDIFNPITHSFTSLLLRKNQKHTQDSIWSCPNFQHSSPDSFPCPVILPFSKFLNHDMLIPLQNSSRCLPFKHPSIPPPHTSSFKFLLILHISKKNHFLKDHSDYPYSSRSCPCYLLSQHSELFLHCTYQSL